MKIRNFFSHIARRAVPILLMAVVTAAAILFAEGHFTLSFLENEAPLPSGTPSSPLGSEPDTDAGTPVITPDDDSPSRVQIPSPTNPQAAMSEDDILRLCGALSFDPAAVPELLTAGYSRSTETYSSDTSLFAYAGGFDFLPKTRSYYDGGTTTVSYVRPDMQSAPVPVYSTEFAEVPAVQLYMGYLLIDDATTVKLYTADGLYLFSYKNSEYLPSYTRDRAGNPIFERTQENEEGKKYTAYYTVGAGGFVFSDYDDAVDNRGVYFDYAPSYGISDNNLMRLVQKTTTVTAAEDGTETAEDSLLWAYGYSPTWRRTTFRYSAAYDFSEELAAVVDTDGKLFYIGQYGYQAYTTQKSYWYYERYVTEYLLPPLTSGPESIGFYYYDHGLVRARRQVVDWHAVTYWDMLRVAVDEDVLLDKKGNIFPIPAGYEIEAYSDGVILLSKDGKYGYMDYTGAWIAQPIYDYARPFSEGVAVAGFADGTRLMIDTAGDIVIPAGEYRYISDVSSGVVAAWTLDGKWEILHKMARYDA